LRYREPWIVFDAIDFLNIYDLQNKRVFEYGSGGSTLFWLKKGAICVSVEHDRAWYYSVKKFMWDGAQLDYRFIAPEPDDEIPHHDKDFADPDNYISSQYTTDRYNYVRYVQQIDD